MYNFILTAYKWKKKVHLQKEKKYHYTAIFYGFTNNQLSI